MNVFMLLLVMGLLILLLMAYAAYMFINRKQRQFKIVIDNGLITSHTDTVPPEFLYDVQQIARIEKLQHLVIRGKGIQTAKPRLIFKGEVTTPIREKFQQSLSLSLE